MTPTFSLCHTTARLPHGWKNAARAWFDACDKPENVEYVLAMDKGLCDGERWDLEAVLEPYGSFTFTVNQRRHCAVDGWNITANAATGRFLISVADDWTPCPHWDTQLLKLIPSLEGEYVLDVNTGGDHGILTFSLLTRAYMNRLRSVWGYEGFFYPEYLGMMADTEFGEIARLDGVVINAKHLLFPHDHPNYTGAQMDAVYQWQHRTEALKTGEEVFLRRMEQISKKKIPRHIDHPGMPPLGELFGINWEPGALRKLCMTPDKLIEEETKWRIKLAQQFEIGEQCEAKTTHGWQKVRVMIRREHQDRFSYRVETDNHIEYEMRQEDLKKIPKPEPVNGAIPKVPQLQGGTKTTKVQKQLVEK